MNQSNLIVLGLMVASAVVGAISVWLAVALRRPRSSGTRQASLTSTAVTSQLNRMEVALESVAVEVERIGEAERFLVTLMAVEPKSLDAPHPRIDAECPSVPPR